MRACACVCVYVFMFTCKCICTCACKKYMCVFVSRVCVYFCTGGSRAKCASGQWTKGCLRAQVKTKSNPSGGLPNTSPTERHVQGAGKTVKKRGKNSENKPELLVLKIP